jgi:hypothetical protein
MHDIVLECNPDEALIKVLGYPRRMITHQSSKGEVINYLARNPAAIGIVDDDPGSAKPAYLLKFSLETEERFGIESYKIAKLGTRLIVIKPRLEEWILKQAKDLRIDLKQHAMPANGNDLHKIINTRISRFENMLKEMLDKKSEALTHLKSLIDKK